MFKPLVGLCIVEVDGNPIPMRTVERWLVQTHKTIFTQEIGARCSNAQRPNGPLHSIHEE